MQFERIELLVSKIIYQNALRTECMFVIFPPRIEIRFDGDLLPYAAGTGSVDVLFKLVSIESYLITVEPKPQTSTLDIFRLRGIHSVSKILLSTFGIPALPVPAVRLHGTVTIGTRK